MSSNHKMWIAGAGTASQCRCSCGQNSRIGPRTDAVEWEWQHTQEVDRARAGIARTPSLTNQRDWFRAMSEDYSNTPADRELWKALADELDARIGTDHPDDQLELW